MRILAIDTSCDDTCIAILEIKNSKIKILSNAVSSQIKIHKKYGGVFPFLAKREHQKNLPFALKIALKKAGLLKKKKKNQIRIKELEAMNSFLKENDFISKTKNFLLNYQKPEIDLIAVTSGPGLEPCLWTGINFAKVISFSWKKPIVLVNHLEGHIFSNWLTPTYKKIKTQKDSLENREKEKTIFPAIALIISGGHTELVFIKKILQYKLLGETVDDAAGECLDKIAKILNLPYPGGPEIEKIAKDGNPNFHYFPRPMINTKDYNFSFSGLKTAVLYFVKNIQKKKLKNIKKDIAASSQEAVIEVLVKKTIKAAKEKKAKTILVGGGVSANKRLKSIFKKELKKEKINANLLFPPKKFSTDNAAMIAISAFYHKKEKIIPTLKNLKSRKIIAKPNLNF